MNRKLSHGDHPGRSYSTSKFKVFSTIFDFWPNFQATCLSILGPIFFGDIALSTIYNIPKIKTSGISCLEDNRTQSSCFILKIHSLGGSGNFLIYKFFITLKACNSYNFDVIKLISPPMIRKFFFLYFERKIYGAADKKF